VRIHLKITDTKFLSNIFLLQKAFPHSSHQFFLACGEKKVLTENPAAVMCCPLKVLEQTPAPIG